MADERGIPAEVARAAWARYLDEGMTEGQRRFRESRAWFVAGVYWQPGDYDRAHMVREMVRMRDLGFTIVRYHSHMPAQTGPGEYDFTRTDDWFEAAAEAGLGVITGLPRDVQPETLERHGATVEEYAHGHLDTPGVLAALEATLAPFIERYRTHPALWCWHAFGEPRGGSEGLDAEYDRRRFPAWLEAEYGTVEALDAAWNMYPEKGRPIVESFEEVARLVDLGEPRPGQAEALVQAGPFGKRNYGANRDLLRYLADKGIVRARAVMATVRRLDPDHPVLTGSHQLFANQPYFRWDTPRWARAGDAFSTSIHLSWHFEPVGGEVDRPVCMQARMTRDYLKGGLTSAYETTGGAVQYSGGYGNAMTPGLMRRLLAAYLAAGNHALGFWTWNHRPGCWEVGEYGMTTLSGRIAAWTHEIGKAARGLRAYHEELWAADDETRVALLQNWDTDAVLLQEPEKVGLDAAPSRAFGGTKMQAVLARIGAARAFLNTHTPFVYLADDEVFEGLAAHYPALYVPHMRAASVELVEALRAYVEAGGRLVVDEEFAYLDPWGKMHPAGEGGPVEQLFGAWIDTRHDARTASVLLGDIEVEGFYGDLVPTEARVVARFDDGRPAISERRLGRGSAVLVAFDAARMCTRPGQGTVERLIARLVWDEARSGWDSDAPLAFRRRASKADHYWLLNDGPSRPAFLRVYDATYTCGRDLFDGAKVAVNGTMCVELPAESALWLRFERA